MQTFWLIRHAHRLDFIEPEWFETAIYPYDPPLSSQGIDRAIWLAEKFNGVPIDRIFTSPFLRAVQTAEPLARSLQLPIQLEWGLCEWLCQDWTPDLPKTTPVGELMQYCPNINDEYRSLVMPCYPETIGELNIRLNTIAHKLIEDNCQNLLAIAHKGSITGIVAALTGEDEWRNYDLPCGGIIKLIGDRDSAKPRLRQRWFSSIVEG
jgi:broad specificity phosphatase PhoE